MATGDIINPKRVRTQANERLDVVDTLAISQGAREHLDAYSRAIEAAPRATGGSSPVGLIFEGFGLTLNPTGVNDNKVRVQSPVGVAFDANGRMLIKEAGTTVDLTLATGNNQIYAYFVENTSDVTARRQITVTSPYTEGPVVMPTKFTGSVGFFTRAGDQTTIVANATVNGVTTALCFLGVATNTAGAITMTGYDPVTAPNGAYATNRLQSVIQPSTPPAANTAPGSIAHILGLAHAALYSVGQAMWKRSDFLTPSAANNYGAYQSGAGGADKAFRQALGFVTVGDGVNIFGDFNTADYSANAATLMTALVAALPAQGGTILIKRGVQLSNFGGATFALPGGKTIEIVGEHTDVPNNIPQITFAAGESFTTPTTPAGRLSLRNLHIRFAQNAIFGSVTPIKIRDVYFESTATTDAGAAIQEIAGATVFNDLDMERVTFSSVQAGIRTTTGLVRVSSAAVAQRIRILYVTHNNAQHEWGTVGLYNIGSQVEIGHIHYNWTLGSTAFAPGCNIVDVDSLDNTTNVLKRYIHEISLVSTTVNPKIGLINLNTTGHVLVERVQTRALGGGSITMTNSAGPVTIERCTFETVGMISAIGSVAELVIRDCKFKDSSWPVIGDGTAAIGTVVVDQCRFGGNSIGMQINGTTVDTVVLSYNKFISTPSLTGVGVRDRMVSIIGSTSISHVDISDNEIRDHLNSNYTNTDATTVPSLFCVQTPMGGTIVCHDNKGSKIDLSSTGNARMAPCLLECTCSANTANWLSIDVHDNNLGRGDLAAGLGSHCTLFRLTQFHQVLNLTIRDNTLITDYDNGIAGKSTLDHLVDIATSNASGDIWTLSFINNMQSLQGGGGNFGAINIDYLHVTKGGGTNTIWDLHITNDVFHVGSSAPAFDLVNAFGIGIPSWAVRNMFIDRCSAPANGSTSGLLWFGVKFGSAVDNFMTMGGVLPGAGVSFGSSTQVYRV